MASGQWSACWGKLCPEDVLKGKLKISEGQIGGVKILLRSLDRLKNA